MCLPWLFLTSERVSQYRDVHWYLISAYVTFFGDLTLPYIFSDHAILLEVLPT